MRAPTYPIAIETTACDWPGLRRFHTTLFMAKGAVGSGDAWHENRLDPVAASSTPLLRSFAAGCISRLGTRGHAEKFLFMLLGQVRVKLLEGG
jgi:hypothetical protein